MICAYFVRSPPSKTATRLDRAVEGVLGRMIALLRAHARRRAANARALTMLVFVATIALTAVLYVKTPKGYFPQDDTGLLFGGTQRLDRHFVRGDGGAAAAGAWTSCWPIRPSPALGSSVGASGFNASVNRGRLFISLKPLDERGGVPTQQVVARLRAKLNTVAGHPRVSGAGAGSAGRRPAERLAISVHAVEPGHRRAQRLGAARAGPHQDDRRRRRRHHRSRARRPAGQYRDRSHRGVAARRATFRTSTTRSTTCSRSGRSRRSTARATNIASILEADQNYLRDPNDLQQIYVAGTRRHAGAAGVGRTASSAASRRWWSTIRGNFRR